MATSAPLLTCSVPWLQRRRLGALDAAVLAWHIDARPEAPGRLPITLYLATVLACLPQLAALPRKRLPPATPWLDFGPGRPLGLSAGVDIASLRPNGAVVGVGADYPVGAAPSLVMLVAETAAPASMAANSAKLASLVLCQDLLARSLMTEPGADGTPANQAKAEVAGWCERAQPGAWLGLTGRWQVLQASRRLDAAQGRHSRLTLQRD